MSDPELRKLIEQLHAEIQKTHAVDGKGKKLLAQLESDIRELLDQAEKNSVHVPPSTLLRLEQGLDHFEAAHPELTTLLSRFLESLSNAGV